MRCGVAGDDPWPSWPPRAVGRVARPVRCVARWQQGIERAARRPRAGVDRQGPEGRARTSRRYANAADCLCKLQPFPGGRRNQRSLRPAERPGHGAAARDPRGVFRRFHRRRADVRAGAGIRARRQPAEPAAIACRALRWSAPGACLCVPHRAGAGGSGGIVAGVFACVRRLCPDPQFGRLADPAADRHGADGGGPVRIDGVAERSAAQDAATDEPGDRRRVDGQAAAAAGGVF